MDERFCYVVSHSSAQVALVLHEYHFSRVWPKRGAKIAVEKQMLLDCFYMPGVERMFKEDILYIEDAEIRKTLGLEAEPVKDDNGEVIYEGNSIFVLDDKMLNRIVKYMPVSEVKSLASKLSSSQKLELADYATKNYRDLNFEKAEVITKITGIDIQKAVSVWGVQGE